MKNIHILPTDKPSRLVIYENNDFIFLNKYEPNWIETNFNTTNQHIYITNDEEIKEGDWIFDIVTKKIEIAKFNHNDLKRDWKKIILTTDLDLIKDGVQEIHDEFLEWFVKNPSCEEVKVVIMNKGYDSASDFPYQEFYKIIIPKEELKSFSDFSDKFFGSIPKEEAKKKHIVMLVGDKVNDEQTKCYCGHTIYCECGTEVPKQETLEEVGEYQQELFNYLYDLGVTALQSEMQEIERIVLGMQKETTFEEEPKQETLEEAAERIYPDCNNVIRQMAKETFINGAKWQQEQIGKSEFLQRLRGTLSDAEARRLIFETFKNK